VAYKGQASEMFTRLLSDIRAGVISKMFRARLVSGDALKKIKEITRQNQVQPASSSRKRHKKKSRKRH